MTSLLAATLGPSSGVAAGLVGSGGLGVAVPCAPAKRSRLFPEVFDEHLLSPRETATIRELNETVFCSFLETDGVVGCDSRA